MKDTAFCEAAKKETESMPLFLSFFSEGCCAKLRFWCTRFRFHVLRKLCIVVFKVSQEQMRPPPPPGVVRSLMGPRDMYRRKVMLARRTVNKRYGPPPLLCGNRLFKSDSLWSHCFFVCLR